MKEQLQKLYDDAAAGISEAEQEPSQQDQAVSKTIILSSLMQEVKALLKTA